MSKGFLHLPTLLFQVACWLWWSVSEMISWQLYLWHEPRLRSCTSRISYSYGMYSCKWRTQYMHPTDPTCSNLDRRSLEVSVHLPGWDFAGGRVHTLPPGGALWTTMDHQGRLGPAMSATSCLVSRVMLGWARPAAQNVLLHSWQ